jgi:hypothetical protein
VVGPEKAKLTLSRGYYLTFLRRILAEIWRFGVAQVVVILVAIAALALQIRYGLVRHGDWKPSLFAMLSPYGGLMVAFIAYQFLRVPKLLYTELQAAARSTEESLRAAIIERDNSLQTLREKPPRTPAEQHDYETAKKALQILGNKGLIALRHIRKHGSLTFGTYNPVLPPGLNLNDTFWVYNHCASEGVLSCSEKWGSGEKTYAVSPKMTRILDELLFEDTTSA